MSAPREGVVPASGPRRSAAMMPMLMLVAFCAFIDRVIVATLGPAIKADLGISDTQFGLLTGLAFALLYTAAGIPIARLADRHDRTRLMAAAIALWSLMTALSGFAANFGQMLLLRLGVGIGEAAANPCAISLISDSYPRHRRATALAIFSMGASAGSLFGGFGGGWLGEHAGWRETFVIVGAPGLLLCAAILLLLRDVPRGRSEGDDAGDDVPALGAVLRAILSKPAFLNFAFACGLTSFVNFGIMLFLPTYFGRSFGMGMAQAGLLFGLATSISNAAGTMAGGLGADWAGRRDLRWYAWLPALCTLVTAPFYMFGLAQHHWQVALPIVIGAATLAFTFYAPTFAATQNMMAPRMRASAAAILIFFQNLVGMGLGPLFVGFLSDRYAAGVFAGDYRATCAGAAGKALAPCAAAAGTGTRYAMMTCAAVLVWAALHYFLAGRTLRRDLA